MISLTPFNTITAGAEGPPPRPTLGLRFGQRGSSHAFRPNSSHNLTSLTK